MPAARFIRTLLPDELATLHRVYRQTDSADLRSRCQIVLLSAQYRAVAEIAAVTFFSEDTVLYWLDRYDREGITGLEERPRSGRPPKS
jgi:transposase